MDDDRMLLQMMEAAIITEGLKLFIGQLKASPHQDTDEYKSLLAFASLWPGSAPCRGIITLAGAFT